MRLGEVAGGGLGVGRPSSAARVWRSEGRASPPWAPRNGPTPDDTLCSRSPERGEGHFPAGPRAGRGKHGKAAPPGGSRRQRTRRPGEPTAPRGSGSAEQGAARLRRRRRRGAGGRGERAESAAPGSQRSPHSPGWRAAAGARAQLAVFRGRNIHGAQRVLPPRRCPSQPRPPRGGERRPAGGGGSREGRAAPPPAEPPLPALSGGGSDGARWPRAGRPGSHAEEQSSLWQARHAPPPPLGGPALLFLLSPPLAPRDPRPAERGRGAADRDPGVPPPRPGGGGGAALAAPAAEPPRRPPL